MATSSTNHNAEPLPLPQYGFGSEVNFANLVKDNHFLFRVYTPRRLSSVYDDNDPFFLAPKFNERYNLSPQEISDLHRFDHLPHVGSYEDVAKHMDWTTRSKSPYISTSFSFIWSIWEALRRYHQGMKKDVEIAVIDASALSNRAVTAVQLLRDSNPSERRSEHWKWYRFAQESQSVLVHEYIPGTALLASVPLVALLEKLPSYFRRPEVSDSIKANPLETIGWDYTQKKQSYRHFCRDMSNRFLQLTSEAQLEATTAGSVRLALAFLRPWFHKNIMDDFQTATVTLCALSFAIAQWPGQWTKDHSEMWNIIRAMVLSLAEEVRESEKGHDSSEVSRLQGVVTELEETVKKYEDELTSRSTKKPAYLLTPLIIPPPMRPTFVPSSPSPFTLAPPFGLPTSRHHPVLTPITPPTSPLRLTAPAYPPVDPISHSASAQACIPLAPGPMPSNSTAEPLDDDELSSSPASPTVVDSPASASSRTTSLPNESPSPSEMPSLCMPLPSEPSCGDNVPPPLPQDPSPAVPKTHSHDILMPIHLPSILHWNEPSSSTRTERPVVRRKLPTIAETSSCLVTGFLVGAFIALCLMSTQRRTLLTHLT